MKRLLKFLGCIMSLVSLVFSVSYSQKIEAIKGVRIIHNGERGTWGKNPRISLRFIKTIGELDADDENVAFYFPSDISFDSQGNLYILDSGNHRIQKFDSQGRYIATIGGKGQGPAEFYFPLSLDVDSGGYLYISDPGNQRIQVLNPEGKEHKTIRIIKAPMGVLRISESSNMIMGSGGGFFGFLSGGLSQEATPLKIIRVIGLDGKIKRYFGEGFDYKDILVNRKGNRFHFTIDREENTYIALDYQNRIEKYSPDGKILWRADRELNYSITVPKGKSSFKRSGERVVIRDPMMNKCSSGVAIDDKGRIWIVALKRQMKEEESIQTGIRAMRGAGGERSTSISLSGNVDVLETDMYQLEVYSSDGILLGKIPLNIFVDDIWIEKDRLFLLDQMRGMQFHEYKIIDN
ncbi:MAG: NHL repeat-containing protein [Candidatus Aminicenantaceae bacterium]